LAQRVADLIKTHADLNHYKILDIGSGCGIIGLELSIHCPPINFIDFLEIQDVYLPFFTKNLNMIHGDTKNNFCFINENYAILNTIEYKDRYDIIVSNPPYFFVEEGLLSPNDFKNRCRFFIDSDFKTLILGIANCLKKTGVAYILVRAGNQHGRNLLDEINTLLNGLAIAHRVEDIRGTHLIQIHHVSHTNVQH
jgi:tRNA1(Val) A37 N6-methylase TrmN6